ncbi:hypothetical protein [Pantoea sp. paga]|uniref:hypothetical protein n=1 Tax=Pantoea sp. paga TaxID=2597519 RepID=UPI00117E4189|nr:hypothetical protein [Pantoea sp. paga]TSH85444.1 hypothetical protein FOV68_05460 [Pantoea sp. paga]
MKHGIRSFEFIDWDVFLAESNKDVSFTLDFHIDAGFSFANAVAHRKIHKEKAKSVVMDDSLKIPTAIFDFQGKVKIEYLKIKTISIKCLDYHFSDITEKYIVTVDFSDEEMNYGKFRKDLSLRYNDNESLSKDIVNKIYFTSYFKERAEKIKNEIVSFIELSGYFAKYSHSSLNLYLNEEGMYFRILQSGGGIQTAGHNPIHPFLLRKDKLISLKDTYDKIPVQYKKYYQKGIHYQFLGFFDESFLCFYKLIENVFYCEDFLMSFHQKNDKFGELKGIQKSRKKLGNQKKMTSFICEWIIEADCSSLDEQNKLFDMFEELIKIRNEIAHGSDQSEKSNIAIRQLIALSNLMLNQINSII